MYLRIAGLSTIGTLVLPALASAVTLNDTLLTLSKLLNGAIGLFVTIAVVVFFWGLVKYLWSQDAENAHEGLKIMFWGLIAIFVMVSIWGIIRLLQATFNVGGGGAIVPSGIRYEESGGGWVSTGEKS